MRPLYLAILAVLVAALGALYVWEQGPKKVPTDMLFTRITPELGIESVDALEAWVEGKGEHLRLWKGKEGWMVKAVDGNFTFDAPCDEGRVKRAVERLSALEGEFRAEGKELLSTFGLGEDEALHVVLKSGGKEKVHLLVGKRGPRWDSSFVRAKGSDKVYLVSKNILGLFDLWSERPEKSPEPDGWTDKTVISGSWKDLTGITWQKGGTQWTLALEEPSGNASGSEKGGARWVLTKDGLTKTVDAEALKRTFLMGLAPLYASRLVAPQRAEEVGLSKGSGYGRLTLHFRDKGLKIYHVGKRDEKEKVGWVSDERGYLFEVPGRWVEQVEKGPPQEGEGNETGKGAHEGAGNSTKKGAS